MRLIPGTAATIVSALLCLQIRDSYIRHLASGDQAGFALGTFILNSWFLPGAGIALLLGAVLLPFSERSGAPRRKPSWIHLAVLMACGGFFLLYGLALVVPGWWPRNPGSNPDSRVFAATILAFASTVFASALAARLTTPASPGARLLSGVLLAISLVVLVQVFAFVHELFRSEFLPVYLFLVIGPSVAWVLALLRSAWLLGRGRPGRGGD